MKTIRIDKYGARENVNITALFEDILEHFGGHGYEIIIPRGTWIINGASLANIGLAEPIDRGLILPSGTTIRGEGEYATKIIQAGITNNNGRATWYSLFRIQNANKILIEGLAIEGENATVEDTWLDVTYADQPQAVSIRHNCTEIKIRDCRFEYNYGHGVLDLSSNTNTRNYYQHNIGSNNAKNAFNINVRGMKFLHNEGYNNRFALLEASCGDSIIDGNVANSNYFVGISVGGFTDPVDVTNRSGFNNIICNNICKFNGGSRLDGGNGMHITDGTNYSNIYGNTLSENAGVGLVLQGNAILFPGVTTKNNNVYGNNIHSNGNSGASSPIGILVSGTDNNNIHDNIISNQGITGKEQKFGILLSGAKDIKLINNDTQGNTLSDYYLNGNERITLITNKSNPTIDFGTGFRLDMPTKLKYEMPTSSTAIVNVVTIPIAASASAIVKVTFGVNQSNGNTYYGEKAWIVKRSTGSTITVAPIENYIPNTESGGSWVGWTYEVVSGSGVFTVRFTPGAATASRVNVVVHLENISTPAA